MGVANVKCVELGCPGHFVGGHRCAWHRHTQVGNYRVSTVGDYYPKDSRETLGSGKYFETMVFSTSSKSDSGNEGCGCRQVKSWTELMCKRYATAGEAQAGHEATVEMYKKLVKS